MKWNPHQDMENRAYSSILKELFPEQTKTLPRIIVWSIIFLLDLTLGVFGAVHYGLIQVGSYSNQDQMLFSSILLILGIIGVFWLQGIIWGAITRLFRKLFQKKDA